MAVRASQQHFAGHLFGVGGNCTTEVAIKYKDVLPFSSVFTLPILWKVTPLEKEKGGKGQTLSKQEKVWLIKKITHIYKI